MKKSIFKSLLVVLLFALTACNPASQLEIAIKAANLECPMDAGNGVTITEIYTEDNNVVYKALVDENELVSVADFDNEIVISLMKAAMIESLKNQNSEEEKKFLELIKETDYNLVYRYIGKSSNYQVDIVITPDEL